MKVEKIKLRTAAIVRRWGRAPSVQLRRPVPGPPGPSEGGLTRLFDTVRPISAVRL